MDLLPELREQYPTFLLLGRRVAVGSGGGGSSSLGLGLCNNIGLMNSAFDDLLLLGVEVLCEVLVQCWLLLLKFCCLLDLTK